MSVLVNALVNGVTDWRINLRDVRQSVVFPGQRYVETHLLPFAETLALNIREARRSKEDRESFTLSLDNARYRIQQLKRDVFSARKIPQEVPPLKELHFKQEHTDLLMSAEMQRTGGLVVVFGSTGAGKTTTVSAVVKARLEALGGYCLCVENPPEYPLEGLHGTAGYCDQIDATEEGYEKALIKALRCFPAGMQSMLMLGEIRSTAEAYELTQVALDGHLVITTMHAKDIISGLNRLISLAGAKGESDVRTMLASSLTLAVHQSIVNGVPVMQVLKFNHTSSAIVQHGVLHNLQDEILKQNRSFDLKSTLRRTP